MVFKVWRLAACAGLLLTASLPARAADAPQQSAFTAAQRDEIVRIVRDALKRDPSILRDAVEALQADNDARQQAAAKAAIAARRSELATSSDPSAGNPHGDVTVVEFFDVRCPYCKRLEPDLSRLMQADHGVRLVYKDMPILGAPSVLGSKALLAAQRQGKYDALRAVLMRDGAPPSDASIRAAAASVGIDVDRLELEMNDPAIQARIDANLRLAHELGITGTPALVVGGNLIPGAVSLADLESAVASARKAD